MDSSRRILTQFDESSTMAYLHGDVVDGEHEAACDYEYSRESRVLREAARLHRQGVRFEEIDEEIDRTFSCGSLFRQSPWSEFFTCAHFPETPWNSLSSEDRREILRTLPLPYGSRKPVLMHDVRRPERVLQALKEKTAKARAEQTGKKVLPVVYDGQNTGKTGAHKDRLKDLAAWRLFDHCGGDWRKANDFASGHRKVLDKPDDIVVVSGKTRRKISFEEGEPRPFHDPRQGQGKQQINAASLYSEESGFLRARGRARAYLRQQMPWEFFRKAAEEELEEMRERIGRFSVALSQGTAEVSEEATLPPSELELLKQAELERLYAAREARFKRFDPGI